MSHLREKKSKKFCLKDHFKERSCCFLPTRKCNATTQKSGSFLGSNKMVTYNIIYKINFLRTLDSIIQLKLSCAILFINHFCL